MGSTPASKKSKEDLYLYEAVYYNETHQKQLAHIQSGVLQLNYQHFTKYNDDYDTLTKLFVAGFVRLSTAVNVSESVLPDSVFFAIIAYANIKRIIQYKHMQTSLISSDLESSTEIRYLDYVLHPLMMTRDCALIAHFKANRADIEIGLEQQDSNSSWMYSSKGMLKLKMSKHTRLREKQFELGSFGNNSDVFMRVMFNGHDNFGKLYFRLNDDQVWTDTDCSIPCAQKLRIIVRCSSPLLGATRDKVNCVSLFVARDR